MDRPQDKIASAVATCLAYAAQFENPLEQTADLIVLLRAGSGWTEAEISVVESRVRSCLMQRRRGDRQPEYSPLQAAADRSPLPFAGPERRRVHPPTSS
jgi:hypothetical protein